MAMYMGGMSRPQGFRLLELRLIADKFDWQSFFVSPWPFRGDFPSLKSKSQGARDRKKGNTTPAQTTASIFKTRGKNSK